MSTFVEKLDICYLIGVATTVVGKDFIRCITPVDREAEGDPADLFEILWPKVMGEVRRFNGQTLGAICEYGIYEGDYLEDFQAKPAFIRLTGLNLVAKSRHEPVTEQYVGRQALEQIACATIVAVTRDIIMQRFWEELWREEVERKGTLR